MPRCSWQKAKRHLVWHIAFQGPIGLGLNYGAQDRDSPVLAGPVSEERQMTSMLHTLIGVSGSWGQFF